MQQNQEQLPTADPAVTGQNDLRRAPSKPATDSAAAINAQRDRLLGDVANRFTYHPPQADQVPRYNELRNIGKELAFNIVQLTPASREQALALTHLETAIFFANAAIARNE